MKASNDAWPTPEVGNGGLFENDKMKTMGAKKGADGLTSDADSAQQGELQRQLSGRHLNFIAIGGTIGTGFFLGTGTALVKTGPAGCLISYIFVGTILWSVMVCLGEMATYIPTAGAFSTYATRFVDDSLGFAVGWLYWFGCEFALSQYQVLGWDGD
jgi:amino acid transporter